MIGIIDYGMGNIHSVQKALESTGVKVLVINKPEDIQECDKLILPGVGAYKDAMQELSNQGLVKAITDFIRQDKVFLGICLGMQLLFDSSDEAIGVKGLGIIKGKVKRFFLPEGFKVPHMGWNQLNRGVRGKGSAVDDCPLLKGIEDGAYVYFCHSYYCAPKDNRVIAATAEYSKDFCAVAWQDNCFGMQFHPEKSQDVGLKILRNFVEL
ncbi:MAG: imidazole glycerol phosphate synthase subunit HisH [Candidatus Omnitrophota bacterium]|nr:imidazole glycerol phosphate synthase subunit HisH [Candidatus Omnitrophota bacterium]